MQQEKIGALAMSLVQNHAMVVAAGNPASFDEFSASWLQGLSLSSADKQDISETARGIRDAWMEPDEMKRAIDVEVGNQTGTPATDFYLSVESKYRDGRVTVQYDGTHGGAMTRIFNTFEDYRQFFVSKQAEAHKAGLGYISISGSSSMDFPEEDTSNPDTIALAHRIRNGRPIAL